MADQRPTRRQLTKMGRVLSSVPVSAKYEPFHGNGGVQSFRKSVEKCVSFMEANSTKS